MTGRPVDLAAVTLDDALLDAIAAGDRPETSDPVVLALHAWRTELSSGLGSGRVNGTSVPVRAVAHHRASGRPRTFVRRRGRRRAAVAAVAVGLSAGLGGVAVAAAEAEPGSPLWPVTKVIYADTAAEREHEAGAEAAIDKARRALAEGRLADARRYLDEAGRHADSVDDEAADKLRDEVAEVRDQMEDDRPAATDDPSPAPPTPEPEASSPAPTDPLPEPSVGDSPPDKKRGGRDAVEPDEVQPGSSSSTGLDLPTDFELPGL